MGNATEFESFGAAAARVLSYLQQRYEPDTWMINRLRDDDLVIVEIVDPAFGLARGDVLDWRESVCCRMTRGGPRIAARCSELDEYSDAPSRERLGIEAYVGFPLKARDGRILGTLCGIGRSPLREPGAIDPEELELFAGLLGQLLFTARFLVQWIASERAGRSVVPISFWFFSLGGGFILLGYAVYRQDPVFIIGQALGSFIYMRNLMLIAKAKRETEKALAELAMEVPVVLTSAETGRGRDELLTWIRDMALV